MRKFSITTLVMLLICGSFFLPETTAQEIEEVETCSTCLNKRRPKVRTCIKLFGKFDDGEKGGFLATGSKFVCVNDNENQCDSAKLTGCVSEI